MATSNPWLTQPAEAHREWRAGLALADRAYAEHSQRLYNSLFGKFCAWLATAKLNLKKMTAHDLTVFLGTLEGRAGGPASNRTQRTYIAEIDRVCVRLQILKLRKDNPARALLETLRITTPLQPRSITIPKNDTRARYLKSLGKLDPASMAPEALQSCAMNLLMLDCGFTLKELQKVTLKNVDRLETGEVVAPGHRLLLARTLVASPEAQLWLGRWLAVRKALKVVTPAQYKAKQSAVKSTEPKKAVGGRGARSNAFVTFTGKSGRPNGLRGSGLVVDHLPESTIYLSAQDVMLAGRRLSKAERKDIRQKGPQALRNLCCATLVAEGLPAGEIAAFMGLRRVDQVWAMARALKLGTS